MKNEQFVMMLEIFSSKPIDLVVRLMKGEGLKFVRVGLPFFTLVLGSAFALHYFQTVRYEFRLVSSIWLIKQVCRRSKKELETIKHLKNDLTESGVKIKEGVTVDSIYNVRSFYVYSATFVLGDC
ncbi:Cytochrome c oxidase assembly protein COX16-like protein, mitochondrial [Aphelenchoides besseyi]|nr:Cytochrome c oxidase assembly protein COX16-like protein, mitochondrial [Aphelenchoides besseyi]